MVATPAPSSPPVATASDRPALLLVRVAGTVAIVLMIGFLVILNVSVIALLRTSMLFVEGNERRRMEMLQQVAVAVNHELNNCVSTINLQLRLVGRRAPALTESLQQIDQSLGRITSAVQSLKNVRRIVLTDYLPGTKMLDLQRSSEDEPAVS